MTLKPSAHLRDACAEAGHALVDHDFAVPVAGMALPEMTIVSESPSCAKTIRTFNFKVRALPTALGTPASHGSLHRVPLSRMSSILTR